MFWKWSRCIQNVSVLKAKQSWSLRFFICLHIDVQRRKILVFLTVYSCFRQKRTTTAFVTASQIVSVVLLQGVGQKSWMNVGIPYIPVTILMKRYMLFFFSSSVCWQRILLWNSCILKFYSIKNLWEYFLLQFCNYAEWPHERSV